MEAHPRDQASLVLLVDDHEWTSRSLESVLRPAGHAVVKAYTGRQAIDLVDKVSPDVAIVGFHLPDMDGIDVVQGLLASPTLGAVTPTLMLTTGAVSSDERRRAFAAGVWDILRHPLDPQELVVRIQTFVSAKREADRIREQGLTDITTGFYNARGLLRRAGELSAEAQRFRRPIACIAVAVRVNDAPADREERTHEATVGRTLADALSAAIRRCDSVGALGHGEFLIVAPGTTREGAIQLARRVQESFEESHGRTAIPANGPIRIGAGYYAPQEGEVVAPEDLLLKATTALRRAQSEDGAFRIRSYDA